ncbi:hypothetical protein ACLK1T_06790 [Escherichia coli]
MRKHPSARDPAWKRSPEGVLTRMIERDPELSGVGSVILDEFSPAQLRRIPALALCDHVQARARVMTLNC